MTTKRPKREFTEEFKQPDETELELKVKDIFHKKELTKEGGLISRR